jgi:hypothetical protein
MHQPLVFSKKQSLDYLEQLLKNSDHAHDVLTHMAPVVGYDFEPYRLITFPNNTVRTVSPLSIFIQHHHIEGFQIVLNNMKKIYDGDLINALSSSNEAYIKSMIALKPLKTFEELLKIGLSEQQNDVLNKIMAAMEQVIHIKGCDFLNHRLFNILDNTAASYKALHAVSNHHHIPLLQFFIRMGASPNIHIDDNEARLIEHVSSHWHSKLPEPATSLTEVCLTLIGAGAKLDNLSIAMKNELLKAAIKHQHKSAAIGLLGLYADSFEIYDDNTQQYRTPAFFSIGSSLKKHFWSCDAQPSILKAQELAALKELLKNPVPQTILLKSTDINPQKPLRPH